MNPDSVFAGADKRFDLEVLLEHLEKAFDLPASLIDVADGFPHRRRPLCGDVPDICLANHAEK